MAALTVQGFDVTRFMKSQAPVWQELEELLRGVDLQGLKSFDIARARHFGKLYRTVSSDLIRARTEMVDATVIDYLNDLVARSYAHIHAGNKIHQKRATDEPPSPNHSTGAPHVVLDFFLKEFPRLFRAEWKAISLAAAVFLSGAAFSAIATSVDPSSLGVLIPEDHQELTPQERIAEEHSAGGTRLGSGDNSAAFSSFLFTHNIQVTFLVFALGITFGVGTLFVLFTNGIMIGSLAVHYHVNGGGLFFWAWILPHGIPEITVVCIAGGAGLIVARGLWMPGVLSRKDAVVKEARRAVRLIVGGMPLLVLAGVIEGTISQMHEPMVPAWLKLAFAVLIGIGTYAYLLLAGRAPDARQQETT